MGPAPRMIKGTGGGRGIRQWEALILIVGVVALAFFNWEAAIFCMLLLILAK